MRQIAIYTQEPVHRYRQLILDGIRGGEGYGGGGPHRVTLYLVPRSQTGKTP